MNILEDLKPKDWFDWLCWGLILMILVPMTSLNIIMWSAILTSPNTKDQLTFEQCIDLSVGLGKIETGDSTHDKPFDNLFHKQCDTVIENHEKQEWG